MANLESEFSPIRDQLANLVSEFSPTRNQLGSRISVVWIDLKCPKELAGQFKVRIFSYKDQLTNLGSELPPIKNQLGSRISVMWIGLKCPSIIGTNLARTKISLVWIDLNVFS